jgi:DNA-directed RNA polymerase subunit RPC12/RpoP
MARSTEIEIFFRCTACRRRLAAEMRARGAVVQCPACGASLLVPQISTALNPAILRRIAAAAILLSGLLGFGAAGWALARRGAPSAQTGPAAPAVAAIAAAESNPSEHGGAAPRAQVERELRAARQAQEAASRRYEELANWVLTNMRGRFLLKERHVPRLRFMPVAEDYSVNPDLADFLSVDERENGLLSEILQYGRTALLELQTRALTATQPAPDQVVLHFSPFPREGELLREDLYGAMRNVLGADRFGRLLQVSAEEFTRAYDYFGSASRTLSIQLMPGERPRDPPHLAIRDAWVIPKDDSTRVTELTEEATRELPRRYTPYLAWMPDFVSFYVKP